MLTEMAPTLFVALLGFTLLCALVMAVLGVVEIIRDMHWERKEREEERNNGNDD